MELNEGYKIVIVKKGCGGQKDMGANPQLVQSKRFVISGVDAGEDSSELTCMEHADSQGTLGNSVSNSGWVGECEEGKAVFSYRGFNY